MGIGEMKENPYAKYRKSINPIELDMPKGTTSQYADGEQQFILPNGEVAKPSMENPYAKYMDKLPEAKEEKGIFGKAADNLRSRGAKLNEIVAATDRGEQTRAEKNLQLGMSEIGALAGAAGDIIGGAVGKAAKYGYGLLPEQSQSALGVVKDYTSQRPIAGTARKGIEAYGQNLDTYNATNPRAGRNFEAVREISNLLPLGNQSIRGVAKSGVKGAGNALKSVGGDVIKGTVEKTPLAAIPSSDVVKDISRASFKEADNLGGILRPENSAKFIDNLESLKKQTKWGLATNGEDAITSLVERYKPLRNEPISLAAAQEIDEGLGQLIDGFYDNKGKINKEGLKIQKAQHAFRKMIEDTPESEIVGGKQGFNAWKKGQREWSAAVRLAEMERIIARAETMDNPATSLKAGFKMLERTGMRGYSTEEKKDIRHAARSGVIGGTLRTVLGSRLIGTGLGAMVGSPGGPVGAALGGAVGAAQSALSRKAAESMQMGRVNKARRTVAKRVGKLPPREALKLLEREK